MNYWQKKLPMPNWADDGTDEFENLKVDSNYPQKIEDKSNMPRDNIGDIIFIHNKIYKRLFRFLYPSYDPLSPACL